MAGLWFCKLAGVTTGPLKPSELRALADSGKLAPDDLVRQGTEGPWVAARYVRGLFALQGPTGSVASSPAVSSQREALGAELSPKGVPASESQAGDKKGAVPTARILPQPLLSEETISKIPQAETSEPYSSEGLVLDLPKARSPSISAIQGASLPPVLQQRRTQNNVQMMVGLAITAVVLLVVVILMFTGVIPLDGQSQTTQKRTPDSERIPAAAGQIESSDITWVDASKKGIRRGTTSVSILSARLADAPAAWVEKPGEYLLVDIQIRNQADDKFFFFARWSRGLPDGSLLRLVDNKGTAYRQIPRMDLVGARDDNASLEKIPPGGIAKDTLVFEPPKELTGIEYFRLELPGLAFPKEKFDPFRFQITAKMIRTGEETSAPVTEAEELFGPSKPSETPQKIAPSKEDNTPPIPKPKLDPGQEELERLMKELAEEEESSPSGPDQQKPPKEKSSAAGMGNTEPTEEAEPADSKPTKPRRPVLPGQNILDQLDTRVPPKEPSQEKE